MTSRLRKNKSKSSLDTKYVDNFLKNVESKLYDFNRNFLLPYKKKLDSKDKSVISDIAKDFKSPTLVIKNALDELWNYHWMLGQGDVFNSTFKRSESNYQKPLSLITFAESDIEVIRKRKEASAEKEILKELNRRVIRLQKDINRKSDRYSKESLKATLKGISKDLEKYLGNNTSETTEVRIRDLQETIRTLDLKLSESKSPNPERVVEGIDILNSSEFGTIYQNKRTLLLAGSVSQDYKQKVINKIQNYFDNTNKVRSKTREQDLFNSLTTKPSAKQLKILKELGEKDINTFSISRIKRIAETEISVAYNIGRLKKLEELGYTKVKVTNEKENRINREVALSKFGSLAKAYRATDSESYLPILCTHCLARSNDAPIDINQVYKGKVDTKYNGKYSLFPPFHVSCWCYLEGVEGDGKKGGFIPEVDDSLILSGLGLLSVAGAYLAYNKLGKNKIDIPQILAKAKNKVEEVAVNIGNSLLGRPKVNIPLKLTPKQIEDTKEVLNVSDEAFNNIQSDTNTLLRIPINLSPKTSNIPEEVLIEQIDEALTNTPYKTLNTIPKTVNQVIDDIPDYVQSLRPIVNARNEYYRLRNIIYDTSVPLETRQSLYNTYMTSRANYDSLISKHLENTRNLKNTVNNIQSQLSVDGNKQILANRNTLPNNITLDDVLRSRNALTLTDRQLKAIRDNLALERKRLREKIGVESKVLDSSLNGIDTQYKAQDLRDKLEAINEKFTLNTKTLDKVVANITSIKKELNNISKTKETVRSISSSRINSGSIVDKQLLIDTQETYIKKVIAQQKLIAEELKKLPQDNGKLDSFVNLYRSEIQDKANKSYSYSTNLWSNKELISLRRKYEEVSNVVTVRNTYQSYLDETEDMLAKLSNFENNIGDNTLNFSYYYEDDIMLNKEKLNRLLKLPTKENIVLR